MRLVKRIPLHLSVANDLAARIKNELLKPGDRLPSEAELAKEFNVSRLTVREALSHLESQGIIAKRHGLGSFVIGMDHGAVGGLERMESYTETIRRSGHEAGDRVLSITPAPLPPEMSAEHGGATAGTGYEIRSVRTLDGIPVILAIDTIRGDILKGREEVLEARRNYGSLLEFLEDEIGVQVCYSVMTVSAVAAPADIAEILQVAEGYPLVHAEGIVRDRLGGPIYYSSNYFRSDKYRFTFVRRSERFTR